MMILFLKWVCIFWRRIWAINLVQYINMMNRTNLEYIVYIMTMDINISNINSNVFAYLEYLLIFSYLNSKPIIIIYTINIIIEPIPHKYRKF
jgi:hypothetical protein